MSALIGCIGLSSRPNIEILTTSKDLDFLVILKGLIEEIDDSGDTKDLSDKIRCIISYLNEFITMQPEDEHLGYIEEYTPEITALQIIDFVELKVLWMNMIKDT